MVSYRLMILIAGTACALATVAQAGHVSGYTRKNGTYVAPYERTNPNSTKNDNYSTLGNVNPYTGKPGTKQGDTPSYYVPTPSYTAPTTATAARVATVCRDGVFGVAATAAEACAAHGGLAPGY